MKSGDQVKTIFGKTETIMTVIGDCQITTFESAKKGNWYHPSKLSVIK